MAIYTDSKGPASGGAVFPENAIDGAWSRCEPLLTPGQLRTRHLFGIPLVSFIKDPITGKAQVMTDEILKDYIVRAVSIAESDTHMDIMPLQRDEKYPFDKQEYESFGYFKINHRPVASIELLSIRPATNQDVYVVPLEWVETAYLPRGQINIIPLTIAISPVGNTPVPVQGTGGAIFLSIFANKPWIPAFWNIRYTSGFPDGCIPTIVNELIGTIAAMEVLSSLAATFRITSTSLGIDAMSQGVSGPGPTLYQVRFAELKEKRERLIAQLKAMVGLKLFSQNI